MKIYSDFFYIYIHIPKYIYMYTSSREGLQCFEDKQKHLSKVSNYFIYH